MDTLGPDLEDTVAAELVRLQRAAYAVEAALIGDDRIPPLHEGPADLRAARLRWFVVREAAGLVAAVGFTEHDGEVDIDRLVVHPSQHRRGLGRRLVERVLRDAERAVVATGRDNAPARGPLRGARLRPSWRPRGARRALGQRVRVEPRVADAVAGLVTRRCRAVRGRRAPTAAPCATSGLPAREPGSR